MARYKQLFAARSHRWLGTAMLATALLAASTTLAAAATRLTGVDVTPLPGDKVQVKLKLDGPAPEPRSFSIDSPARVAVDLADTKVAMDSTQTAVNTGVVHSVVSAEGKNRTRVVVNLDAMVPYDVSREDNAVVITLGTNSLANTGGKKNGQLASFGSQKSQPTQSADQGRHINKVDFRRGEDGEGRVLVTLSDPKTPVDVKKQGNSIVADFVGADIAKDLTKRYNVMDFATPVKSFDVVSTRNGARVIVTPVQGAIYDQMSYQADNKFALEFKPLTKAEQELQKKQKPQYTGDRLTLNFQDIEVRSALQIIADFTGLNIVVSDSVTGNVTLRLQNVPWDQALDIILKSKGLDMRRNGNVIMVAPTQELAQQEQAELQAKQQLDELAPLQTQIFQVNYAKASDLASLIRSGSAAAGNQQKSNLVNPVAGGTGGSGGSGGGNQSLLSDRGSVTVDERTNTLLIRDTPDQLESIRQLINRLDVPVRQVLIESRIVIASDDFSRELGARVGYSNNATKGGRTGVVGASVNGNHTALNTITQGGQSINGTGFLGTDNLNVNVPVSNPAGRIAFAILGKDYLVDLELSALQAEGKGEVVSSPRVLTSNQKKASIQQGVEIPYQANASSGATTVQFKEAVLGLEVTPQITPDDHIIMDLVVRKDSVGEQVPVQGGGSVPSIDTRSVQTQALVENGATVVLGGIYETERRKTVNKVPLLGDIPLLGALFRNTKNVNNKSELLIFITPKIVDKNISSINQY